MEHILSRIVQIHANLQSRKRNNTATVSHKTHCKIHAIVLSEANCFVRRMPSYLFGLFHSTCHWLLTQKCPRWKQTCQANTCRYAAYHILWWYNTETGQSTTYMFTHDYHETPPSPPQTITAHFLCHYIWHSLWHSIRHSTWHPSDIVEHFIWHSDILRDILHSQLSSRSAHWYLALEVGVRQCPWDLSLAVEVRQCPGVPTEIWRSRWSSGSARWDLSLAI